MAEGRTCMLDACTIVPLHTYVVVCPGGGGNIKGVAVIGGTLN